MDLSIYLAFTGAEAGAMAKYSGKTAWLGCHLSPYGSGISSIPAMFSHCDMLILTDETPADGHDPDRVAEELVQVVKQFGCERILLDFQRPRTAASAQIAEAVLSSSSCPVGIAESHAEGLDCPVLVNPPPLWTTLDEHLQRWKGRELWLEAATEDACVTVTGEGSRYAPWEGYGSYPFKDDKLALSYRAELSTDQAKIYLHRGAKELSMLLSQAEGLGIHTAVGLYQQLSAPDTLKNLLLQS